MLCFSGKGCSEFPIRMHFCIGILKVERERGYQVVKSAINGTKELGSFGERRIALENLLDILSEVGLFLSIEQINIADRAFGSLKNMNEEILIDYYKKNLVKN